jgi:hypothetical protein
MWIDLQSIAAQLSLLDDTRFAKVCDELLIQTAVHSGIDRGHLALNLATNEPDGGIDARCTDVPHTHGRLFPRLNSVYQFKSGNFNRSAAILAKQDILEKPRVMAAVSAGHAVIFMMARDRGDSFEEQVLEEAQRLKISLQQGQLVILTGVTLATFIKAMPALAASVVNLDMLLLPFEHWQGQRRLRNPYRTDEKLRARLDELRAKMVAPRARIRLLGSPGDGKTRTVLEAIRGTEVEAIALYAEQPEEVPPSLLCYLRQTPDARCLLVVDEVDDENAERFQNQCDSMPDRVGLVLIGINASGRGGHEVLQVEGLSEDLLVTMILAITPGLPERTAREIAQVCERSPKLAVLIAERIRDDPRLASHSLRLADRSIRNALDEYLDLEEDDWFALSAVSLFERMGWKEKVEEESVILYRTLNLDPTVSRRRVEDLHERYGIVPLAGRFRYISPGILGDHLAARQLRGWTGDNFRTFFGKLTPAMAESLARRIRRLSAVIENREIVEVAVLGDRGPFRGIDELEQSGMAALLKNLAGAFPQGAMRALDRIIGTATADQLKASTRCRRDMVWALEELLWSEDTFEPAACLVLRLALTENETWSNNATGLWTATFQTMLGHTAAGLEPRFRVLKHAAQDANPEARRLAAVALQNALKIGHITRFGNPPEDIPGMPVQEWRPATYGEWTDAILRYLDLVRELITDREPAVRLAAVDALNEALDVTIKFPRVLPKWAEIARLLIGTDYELRGRLAHAIDIEIARAEINKERPDVEDTDQPAGEEHRAVEEQMVQRLQAVQELMQELLGDSFSSRLRWISEREPWRLHTDTDEGQRRRRKEIEGLAREAIAIPALMDTEWEWLVHNQGAFPEEWAEILGRLDTDRSFVLKVNGLAETIPRAIGWASLYEIANAEASGSPERIDNLVDQLRHARAKGDRIFDLLLRTGYSPKRLEVLRELFSTGAIEASRIDRLTWSQWREALAPSQVIDLLRILLQQGATISSLISFTEAYLHTHPAALDDLRETGIDLLHRGRETDRNERTMHGYHWEQLAERLVKVNPYEIAQAVLDEIARRKSSVQHSLVKVLQTTWKLTDKGKLFREVIGPWLEIETSEAWWVRRAIERALPLEQVGVEDLALWVSERPEVRAPRLAGIIGAPSGRPSDAHAMLLERFGDQDVGSKFYGAFVSGAWSGPASVRTRGKLEEAKAWLDDERPAIREWAKGVVKSLQATLEHDLKAEEEERFR